MRLNLAAEAGRWSAAHWKTATFGWLGFVVVAVEQHSNPLDQTELGECMNRRPE